MARNVASGGFTAVQVGSVGGKAPKSGKTDKGAGKSKDAGKGKVTSVVTGNAKVGVVADVIEGGVTVTF